MRLQAIIKTHKQRSAQRTRYYLTDAERREVIRDIGDSGVLLLEYYLRLAAVGDVEITDKNAAQYFGWNIHKAKRYRLALTQYGWYDQVKYKMSNTLRGATYFIGKEAVKDYRAPSPS